MVFNVAYQAQVIYTWLISIDFLSIFICINCLELEQACVDMDIL